MYSRILAAVNEHLNSEIAARYALHLARMCGARLSFCFVAEPKFSPKCIERTEDVIKRLFMEARDMDVHAESITLCGDPVQEIQEIVKREKIDITFVSTRHQDVERQLFTDTVARSLSLKLPGTVALVRVVHAGKIQPREILVPLKAEIDRVEERAFFTAQIARAFGSAVYLFHTPRPFSTFLQGELHLTPLEWEKRLPHDIEHFMEHLRRYKIVHDRKLSPGRTGKTITLEAFSRRHDLIIMGASQRGLLRSLVSGNPVEELLRNTPCDLIILRPGHEHT